MSLKRQHIYPINNGGGLRLWTDKFGQRWACMAYDHGPMCRRCQPIDNAVDAHLQRAVAGLLHVDQDPETAAFVFTPVEGQPQPERWGHKITVVAYVEGERQSTHASEAIVKVVDDACPEAQFIGVSIGEVEEKPYDQVAT